MQRGANWNSHFGTHLGAGTDTSIAGGCPPLLLLLPCCREAFSSTIDAVAAAAADEAADASATRARLGEGSVVGAASEEGPAADPIQEPDAPDVAVAIEGSAMSMGAAPAAREIQSKNAKEATLNEDDCLARD